MKRWFHHHGEVCGVLGHDLLCSRFLHLECETPANIRLKVIFKSSSNLFVVSFGCPMIIFSTNASNFYLKFNYIEPLYIWDYFSWFIMKTSLWSTTSHLQERSVRSFPVSLDSNNIIQNPTFYHHATGFSYLILVPNKPPKVL